MEATAKLTRVQSPADQFSQSIKYLSKGKIYEVVNIEGHGFHIKADTGHIIFCVLENCAHLSFRNWIVLN
jgi:hypothetical protein